MITKTMKGRGDMSGLYLQTTVRTQAHAPCRKPENPFDLCKNLEEFERGHISNMLELTRWDLREAADLLGIALTTLRRKMRKYHLTNREQRRIC
jgi:DNA-binding NtrC family response regulator